MEKISVLMSVYNETSEMLIQSIESILGQDYKNIEFVIVLDNPENALAREILHQYIKSDQRIILIENEINQGLANSLNIALKQATGTIVARMDADDISMPTRLSEEIACLYEGNYDVVFTGKMDIDGNGNIIDCRPIKSSNKDYIKSVLKYNCIINHPSVMIRTRVLKSACGYRNFYCSQDYDLWLRLLSNHSSFGCIPKPLLLYRIRTESITGKNRLLQFETTRYIKKLYRVREKKGRDSYSWEHYNAYLKRHHVFDKKSQQRFNQAYTSYIESMQLRKIKDYPNAIRKLGSSLKGFCWVSIMIHNTFNEKRLDAYYKSAGNNSFPFG